MDYTDKSITQLTNEWHALTTPKVKLDLALYDLANRLKSPRARVFLTQGVMRRLGLIEHALDRIYDIFPPERSEFLSKIETNDLTSFLQAFVINVYGILENIAWVCVLEGSHPDPVLEHHKIGIFKKSTQQYMPQRLVGYLKSESLKQWYDEYARIYRDSTAHRIPPYLPSVKMTPEDCENYKRLEAGAMHALCNEMNIDMHEQLKSEQATIGSITAVVALSLGGEDHTPPILLHPQLICDTLSVHEILEQFDKGMRERYQLEQLEIPDLKVTKKRLNA